MFEESSMKLGKPKAKATEKKLKTGKKKGSKKSCSSFDLLYQLSYMSVIAGAGVPRNQIFRRASQLSGNPAEYFRKVERTRGRLGCDYAKACRMVGESASQEEVKTMLLRFSSSLVSGEPEADFLGREADAQSRLYYNEYERNLESLKQWTDAYVSLTLSAVLVVIIGAVSTMIWKMAPSFTLGLVAIAIGTTVLGVWLIYLLSPRETVVRGEPGSKEQHLLKKLILIFLPLAVVVGALLVLTGANPGWVLMAVAAVVFPIGYISAKDDKKVTKRDVEVGPFLSSLGGACAAIGTTVKDAVGRLDLNAVNALKPDAKRLRTRLRSGIRSKLCWQKFVEDTGSEVAKRSVGMFYDVVEVGGEPGQAGYRASLYATTLSMLRARRKTISYPFRWLCISMHAAVVALLVFVVEVVITFGGMVGSAQEAMPDTGGGAGVSSFTSFNYAGLGLIHSLVLPLVLVFTVANALAPSVADGGSRWKICYNLSITMAISGACLAFLPSVASTLFSSIQR